MTVGGHPANERETSLESEVAAIVDRMMADSPGSADSLSYHRFDFRALARYLQRAQGVTHLRDVSPTQAAAYINRPLITSTDVRAAAATTVSSRRAMIRTLFRFARSMGLADSDPTLDIEIPDRPARSGRPLTDEEVTLCRAFSLSSLRESRRPAAWALAEATTRVSEMGHIRVSDVDLPESRVWIHGGTRTRERWGHFDEWGVIQIERRLRELVRRPGDPPLVISEIDGPSAFRLQRCRDVIAYTLRRAGLQGQPGVGPASIAAWAGAHAFADGASIDEVARMLGMATLDRAAQTIGFNWRPEGLE